LQSSFKDGKVLMMNATDGAGAKKTFKVRVRIDTPNEALYYQHGGILQYVLRQLIKS
jgi:aconitate hydratase